MQYHQLRSGPTVIEFHNNWLGEETVIANGRLVSKKSSFWGTHHYFTVVEDGHTVRYILTTKVGANMQVLLDLSRNGKMIEENVAVAYGSKPRKPPNKAIHQGLLHLQEYDLDEAERQFAFALDLEPENPEIHFHLACIYSIREETRQGYECLKKAVAYGLQDHEEILNHDMLAYLRMQPAFADFVQSGFREFDPQLIDDEDIV